MLLSDQKLTVVCNKVFLDRREQLLICSSLLMRSSSICAILEPRINELFRFKNGRFGGLKDRQLLYSYAPERPSVQCPNTPCLKPALWLISTMLILIHYMGGGEVSGVDLSHDGDAGSR